MTEERKYAILFAATLLYGMKSEPDHREVCELVGQRFDRLRGRLPEFLYALFNK